MKGRSAQIVRLLLVSVALAALLLGAPAEASRRARSSRHSLRKHHVVRVRHSRRVPRARHAHRARRAHRTPRDPFTKQLVRPAPRAVAPVSKTASRRSNSAAPHGSASRKAPAARVSLMPSPEPSQAPATGRLPAAPSLADTWSQPQVRSVRFDAAYYYGVGKSARALAAELTQSWADKGINLVYYYAYNRVYGARYYTRYAGMPLEDYGQQDLLGHMLREAHARGVKVVAWLSGPQSKQMWESHPDWRQKRTDGSDYQPDRDSFPLCVRHPEVQQWWFGLIADLLDRYPELDGVDIAEAQVDLWGDNACHCARCQGETHDRQAWREYRAEGLTEFLLATTRLVRSRGRETHITTTFTARPDGALMSPDDIRDATGFDLRALLASPDRPDVIQAELIWQQWAALYRDQATFTARWTQEAVRRAKQLVAGRAKLIAHVELTDFGCGGLSGPSITRTVASAVAGAPYGVDIYDAHQLDRVEGATQYLQTAWLPPSG